MQFESKNTYQSSSTALQSHC